MRVALVTKHLQLGGIETVVRQLWNGLRHRGMAAELWVSEYVGWPSTPDLHLMYPPLLNRLQRTRFSRSVERFFPRRFWTERVFRELRQTDHDVVHVHGFDGTYADLAELDALARAKPVIVTLHGAWFFTGGCGQPAGCDGFTRACGSCPQLGVWPVPVHDNTSQELAKKRRLLVDSRIRFVSPARHLREDALRSAPGGGWTIEHIPNGVDTALFRGEDKQDPERRRAYGVDPDRTVILLMNREFGDPVKGSPLMTDALAAARIDNAQVVLVGGSSDRVAARLPERLRPIAIPFTGDVRARTDLFALADVFLMTSVAVTFPCVVLEAMSSECCVVSTPLAGVREQLDHGESGLIAEALSAAAVAGQLELACGDPALRRRMGRRAREVIHQRFSEERMLRRYEELYRSRAAAFRQRPA